MPRKDHTHGRRSASTGYDAPSTRHSVTKGGPGSAAAASRHRLAALMMAMGKSREEIASTLGYTKLATLDALTKSPMFQQEVETYAREIRESLLTNFADRIVSEGDATIDRLISLRDQEDDLSVALGATKAIMERIMPRRAVENPTQILINISAEDLAPALSALDEQRRLRTIDAVKK